MRLTAGEPVIVPNPDGSPTSLEPTSTMRVTEVDAANGSITLDLETLKAEQPALWAKLVRAAKRKQPRDRPPKRVKPRPQYVTVEECQAMILHALDTLFAEAERRSAPLIDPASVQ